MNAYLIGSPLQLLNAIEAKHFFKFKDNFLILILGLGYTNEIETYKQLLCNDEWDDVRYVTIRPDHLAPDMNHSRSPLLGYLQKCRRLFRQYSNRRALDKIAGSLPTVENMIVGNYLQRGELYMRHFANSLRYQNLYLIDDGSDVLMVNHERKTKEFCNAKPGRASNNLPTWQGLKRTLRKRFIDWDSQETDKVVFFTAYDLDVRQSDRVVKNSYLYLKEKITHGESSQHVLLLGQSLVEDEYIQRDVYLDYLLKVRRYFGEQELIYVPHPRESSDTLSYVQRCLGWRTEKLNVPIEVHLTTGTGRPGVIASFCCSALVNCALLCGASVDIKAFYIEPLHLLKNKEFIEALYGHFNGGTNSNFEVVRLN